jgi:hypothetical protein
MTLFWRTLLLCLASAELAFPQAPLGIDYEAIRLEKVVTAVRVTEKISLDGQLEEPSWKLAVPAKDFITSQPRAGERAVEQTEVRFLYDDDNLYVGFICFDSDPTDNVVVLREDFQSQESDGVAMVIDSLHDRRSAFQFGTNPAGAKRDSQVTNNSQFNNDWDSVWDVKVSTNNEGWTAEFVIPFKTLRFSQPPAQEWGVNLSRFVVRRNEQSFWSPIPIRYSASRVSQSGTLKGLEGIRQGRNLKVKPFATAGITQLRGTTGPMQTQKDYDGGIDAKYSLTSSLTLDATYRTDFAQVEVDQQQVNLTRFNLFFPEKRDFFLENAGIFNFGGGNNFQGGGGVNLVPFFSRTIGLSGGTPIPIVGGARVSGRVGQYETGFLTMKTESFTDGSRSIPSNNYLVGRFKRSFSTSSWLGALVTDRDSTRSGDYNRVYGADAHFQFFDKLEFDSFLLRSDTPGKSGKNQARKFATSWRDDELVIAAEYNSVQTNFNPEMGFIRRRDMTQYSGDFSWLPLLRRSRTIRNLIFSTSLDYYEGVIGKVETRTQGINLGVQFQNRGNINFSVNENFDRLVNTFFIRSTRQGHPSDLPIAPGDYQYREYLAKFSTGQSRKISGNGNVSVGEFWDGHRKSFTGGLSWRLDHHLNIEADYSYNRVNLPNGSFTTNLIGSRFLYGFTPRLFLNAFFQYNADTHQVSSNIRFNFIHHPLSDLYLVYNDRRDTLTGQPIERAFIIKLTNLFNF